MKTPKPKEKRDPQKCTREKTRGESPCAGFERKEKGGAVHPFRALGRRRNHTQEEPFKARGRKKIKRDAHKMPHWAQTRRKKGTGALFEPRQ